ncbi:zinc finger protein 497-like [Branchiostoma lanceolatum]|uniref:zinc finger protein 497-like n=1 Tax=Branchiostoma lanceolatum TaxID=7740 RepID=UPI0034534BA2
MAECRYSLRRRQKQQLADEHPLDQHFQPQEKSKDSESHTCQKCGRHFRHAHHFKKHVKTCTSSKTKTRRTYGSFACKTCEKVFSRSDWLRRHQEVHSKERPFRCKLCSASYKRRDALQRHELIQHTWPDEQVKKAAASEARCVKCGKVYMAGEISRHMAMSHSNNPDSENISHSENMSHSTPSAQPQTDAELSHSAQLGQQTTDPDSENISHVTLSEQPQSGPDVAKLSNFAPSGQSQADLGPTFENKPSRTDSEMVGGETDNMYPALGIVQHITESEQKQVNANSGNKHCELTDVAESKELAKQQHQDTDSQNKLVEKTFEAVMNGEDAVVAQSRGQTSQDLLESDVTDRPRERTEVNMHHQDKEEGESSETRERNGEWERSECTTGSGNSKTAACSTLGENRAEVEVGMFEENEPRQEDASSGVPSEPTPSGKDRHHCNTCGDWLPTQERLARHEEEVHGVVSFICPECRQLFQKIHLLEKHLSTHLGYIPHLCTVCKTPFRGEEELKTHLEEEHHFKDLQKCLYCAQTLPTRFHMNAHIRLLHEACRAWCHLCQKPISPFHTLAAHRKLVHGERKLRCEECGALFKSTVSLKAHLLRHRGTNSCLCDYCGKRFNCKKELQGHVAKVHDPALKRHVCEICGHRTWILSDLMDHKYRLHPDQITDNEKHKSSLYRRQKNLIRRPAQRYTCPQCGKRYLSMLHLQRHLALHDGTAHACAACGQKFLKEADYRRHLATHGKTYACGVCGKTFRKKQNCERHELATCRGEKEFRFTCSVCGKMLKFLSQYTRHVGQHPFIHQSINHSFIHPSIILSFLRSRSSGSRARCAVRCRSS